MTIMAAVLAAIFTSCCPKPQSMQFGEGTLTLTALQDDAVRIQYAEGPIREMPEMVYEQTKAKVALKKGEADGKTVFLTDGARGSARLGSAGSNRASIYLDGSGGRWSVKIEGDRARPRLSTGPRGERTPWN